MLAGWQIVGVGRLIGSRSGRRCKTTGWFGIFRSWGCVCPAVVTRVPGSPADSSKQHPTSEEQRSGRIDRWWDSQLSVASGCNALRGGSQSLYLIVPPSTQEKARTGPGGVAGPRGVGLGSQVEGSDPLTWGLPLRVRGPWWWRLAVAGHNETRATRSQAKQRLFLRED
jgi:hypothetical protein